ncbi:DUF6456 domain-containing protein [Enterovirga rhinocerotis]|uniref:DUF6456 domain-containing protein n=1 Tax=Enterovirga rhinocerotis TaxID=1339210 RepID=A0A4V3DXI3_9HYPH|nr:DUF6456 domain-containing protein [Enterovirga rhinocerotis]TDR88939.1 hypothetical protein EV668_3424 [Enterovirga rhinocerotis]
MTRRSVQPSARHASSGGLSKAAERLLAALAAADASVRPDPSRDGYVIVQASRGGVSLGRGAHPDAVLAELLSRDLVESRPAGRAVIGEAGRAWLRRAAARREGGAADAFAAQHRELAAANVEGDVGSDRVSVNHRESPLAWLRRRRDRDGEPLIDAAAFEAGERLRRDLTFAGMLPSVTARWEGAIGGGGLRDPASATDAVIAARQRVRAALGAVGGDLSDLLLDLCGFLKGLETIERERRWPPRSGKIVVRLALGQLARHYGLSSEARGLEAGRGLRGWTADEASV